MFPFLIRTGHGDGVAIPERVHIQIFRHSYLVADPDTGISEELGVDQSGGAQQQLQTQDQPASVMAKSHWTIHLDI